MNGATFRCLRELMGLTTGWCATFFDVAERTIHRWEHEHSRIPDGVADAMRALAKHTEVALDELVFEVARMAEPLVVTYRTDADFAAAHPDEVTYPASWNRALVGRLLAELPNTDVVYWVDDRQ